MKIKTRDFGELEMSDEAVINFARPIYGFEKLSKFVILTDDELGNDILWLQSIEDTNVCFVTINLVKYGLKYDEELSEEVTNLLKVTDRDDVVFLVTCNIKDTLAESTVNLKSPILINTATQLGLQEIMDADYDLHFPLFKEVA